jgi:hypothetical protein
MESDSPLTTFRKRNVRGAMMEAEGCRISRNDRLHDQGAYQISGERRIGRRYGLHLDLQYRLIRPQQVPSYLNSGKTVDLSSAGIAFETNEALPVGAHVELSISWPVLLNQDHPLKLVISGSVIRSHATLTAVRMERYEFRTLAAHGLRAMAASVPV